MLIYSTHAENCKFNLFSNIYKLYMLSAFHLIDIWFAFRVECCVTKFTKRFCLHVRVQWHGMQIGFAASKGYQKKGFRHIARHHLKGHFTVLIAPHWSSVWSVKSLVPEDVIIAFKYNINTPCINILCVYHILRKYQWTLLLLQELEVF